MCVHRYSFGRVGQHLNISRPIFSSTMVIFKGAPRRPRMVLKFNVMHVGHNVMKGDGLRRDRYPSRSDYWARALVRTCRLALVSMARMHP